MNLSRSEMSCGSCQSCQSSLGAVRFANEDLSLPLGISPLSELFIRPVLSLFLAPSLPSEALKVSVELSMGPHLIIAGVGPPPPFVPVHASCTSALSCSSAAPVCVCPVSLGLLYSDCAWSFFDLALAPLIFSSSTFSS